MKPNITYTCQWISIKSIEKFELTPSYSRLLFGNALRTDLNCHHARLIGIPIILIQATYAPLSGKMKLFQ